MDTIKLSKRLTKLVDMANRCNVIADIGTDHGLVPAELLLMGKAKKVIATDINEQPLEKAMETGRQYELMDRIDFRLGDGLKTLVPGEANGLIIAGIGGEQIKLILEESIDVVRTFDYMILQPAQNPEVLRAYLYQWNYTIISEALEREKDGRYYEYFKVRFNPEVYGFSHKEMDFELSPVLVHNHDPLIRDYIIDKIKEFQEIRTKLDLNFASSIEKDDQLARKVKHYEEVLKWL